MGIWVLLRFASSVGRVGREMECEEGRGGLLTSGFCTFRGFLGVFLINELLLCRGKLRKHECSVARRNKVIFVYAANILIFE